MGRCTGRPVTRTGATPGHRRPRRTSSRGRLLNTPPLNTAPLQRLSPSAPQLLCAALHAAAALEELAQIDADGLEATLPQRTEESRRGLRQQHVQAVRYRVEAERGGVLGTGDQRVGEQPPQHLPAAGGEG